MINVFVDEAKVMAGYLVAREFRGPGDTLDAATYRLERRYGVQHTFLKRLRHREVKDMLMSNFIALANAYRKASERMEGAYEEEKAKAVDPKLLRMARALAGEKDEQEEA